jgi:N-acyl-D-amino-acid deacylase
LGAAASGNTAAVKQLLQSGVNPNEGRFAGLAPVMFPLMMQNREMVQAFMDAKADLSVRDGNGATTLMWAVYNDDADVRILQDLLKAGVDPNAHDSKGDTALMWAMRRNNPAAVRILEQAGASRGPQIVGAVEKALGLLQKSSPQFIRVSGCVSCHHQMLPEMAMAVARKRGIAFNEAEAVKEIEASVAMWKNGQEHMTKGSQKIPNPPIVVAYGLVGLAAGNYPADETTAAMANFLAGFQQADGSWRSQFKRPPIEASDFTATALSLRAMQKYGSGEQAAARAAEWLSRAEAHTNEDRSMQLLGLAWAKADRKTIDPLARKLLAKQQPGGGWSQLDTPEADSYATGQALYALHTAGVLRSKDEAYMKGVDFLLRTQLQDGSWLVASRSFPVQPYKESGFPHGKDQWISAAGTSWAAMALSLAAPHVK